MTKYQHFLFLPEPSGSCQVSTRLVKNNSCNFNKLKHGVSNETFEDKNNVDISEDIKTKKLRLGEYQPSYSISLFIPNSNKEPGCLDSQRLCLPAEQPGYTNYFLVQGNS